MVLLSQTLFVRSKADGAVLWKTEQCDKKMGYSEGK